VRVKICMSFQKAMFCVTNAAIAGTLPTPPEDRAAYAGAWAERLATARTDCLAAERDRSRPTVG
jgi:hypothetical protein